MLYLTCAQQEQAITKLRQWQPAARTVRIIGVPCPVCNNFYLVSYILPWWFNEENNKEDGVLVALYCPECGYKSQDYRVGK